MRFLVIFFLLISVILLIACSNVKYHHDNSMPTPPNTMLSESDNKVNRVMPKTNKNLESQAYSESQARSYVPYTRYEEERTSNGQVSQVFIKNRGDIPNYYLTPNQLQQNLNINNPQRSMIIPTWQIKW